MKIMELLAGDATRPASFISSAASSILGTAVAHQETASGSRIGLQVRRGTTRSEPVGLARFKNLPKPGGSSIRVERKEKKTDWIQQKATTGPKFSVTLWKCRGVDAKPKQVYNYWSSVFSFDIDFNILGQSDPLLTSV